MTYFHAARQPILDRKQNLFAYELLIRDGISDAFPDIDGDEATSRIIANSQFDCSLSDFTGSKPAFINFTLDALEKKYPSLVPKDQLVVEILETERPTKRLLQQVIELHKTGYVIALDDYIHTPVWRHFFPYISILKIDFLVTSEQTIKEIIQALQGFPHIKLLAEKVETHQQYEFALNLGFSYFQGYFFARPAPMSAKVLSAGQFSLTELLHEINQPELDLTRVIKAFELDVNLAYKLLRYSNSPLFSGRQEISTIKQAIVTLGQTELRKFISVLFSAQMMTDKPPELMALSLTRAKFCEGLAQKTPRVINANVAFLTGMLSLIDVILGQDMALVMEKLPLAADIREALVLNQGDLAALLGVVRSYENSQWQQSAQQLDALNIEQDLLPSIYRDAVAWSNERMEYMLPES